MTGFRKGTPEDLDALILLLQAAVRDMEQKGIHQWDAVYPNRKDLEQDVRTQTLYVCAREGKPIAMGVLNEQWDPEYEELNWKQSGNVCILHRLCIHPAVQGRGMGRQMLLGLEEAARSMGYTAIRLDAFSQNPHAQRLYRGMGYAYVGDVVFRKGVFHCYEKGI